MVQTVRGSEEEEFDNFTVMPNYRYENETTTSGVSEQLLGDQYETYAFNNATSGTSNLEKSRKLNTRDFHVDSRFLMDVGGNDSSYARDVLGDPWDFTDDTDGFTAVGGTGTTLSVSGGLQLVTFTQSVGNLAYTRISTLPVAMSTNVYDRIEFRIKASTTVAWRDSYSVYFFDYKGVSGIRYDISADLTTSWTDYSIDFADFTEFGTPETEQLTGMYFGFKRDVAATVYIDEVEIHGSLDFASHVEGEIEDEWSWSDSKEYFYDTLGNVSDFNDGTTEDWDNYNAENLAVTTNNWLNVSSNAVNLVINRSGLTIDASEYVYFTVELYVEEDSGDTLEWLRVYDNSVNNVANTSVSLSEGDYYLYSVNLSEDSDWTSTETGLIFEARFSSGNYHAVHYNFTYLYDVSLGDLETWSDNGNLDRQYVSPGGYFTATCASGANDIEVTESNLDIPTDNFAVLEFRIRSLSETRIRIQAYGDGTTVDAWITGLYALTSTWQTITVDVSTDADWSNHDYISYLSLVFYDKSGEGNLEGDEIIQIDYFLIKGFFSQNDGLKYSFLNQNGEEGMYFQFTRDQDSNEYTMHVDMTDASGIALSYEIDFNYSTDDGFLRLDVDWHLDKKEMKFKFMYENLTEILNTRSMTDIYSNLGNSQLLLLQEGFPAFCFNNSVGVMARSYCLLDYLDADWDILDFQEPSGNLTNPADSVSIAQDQNTFEFISPFGFRQKDVDTDGEANKHYGLPITKFDGLTFDVNGLIDGNVTGDDEDDFHELRVYFNNMATNGTKIFLAGLIFNETVDGVLGEVSRVFVMTRDSVVEIEDGEPDNYEASVSFIVLDESSTIMQLKWTSDDVTITEQFNFSIAGFAFTNEFYIELAYRADNSVLSADYDERMAVAVSGFDVTRKDILRDSSLGLLLGPLDKLWITFVTPLLVTLQVVFRDLFAWIQVFIDIFTPWFNTLEGLIEDANEFLTNILTAFTTLYENLRDYFNDNIKPLLDDVEDLLQDIVDAIDDLYTDLADYWNNNIKPLLDGLEGLLGNIITELQGLISDGLNLLWTLVEEAFNFVANIVFFFWDALSLPNLLELWDMFAADIITLAEGLPDFLGDLTAWLFQIYIFVPIFMFAYMWLVPAFKSSNIGEFVGEFAGIAFTDLGHGITIMGFGPVYIPYIGVILLLMVPYGAGLIPALGGTGW